MKRRSERLALLGLVCALAVAGCGGRGPSVSSPMSARDTALFDGGRDNVSDPALLPEAFADNYLARLAHLAERSDVIARVTITRSVQDRGPEGISRVTLFARVDEQLEGRSIDALRLSAREDDPAFAGLERDALALQDTTWLAFIKWSEASERAPVEAEFHLSPASEPVLAALEAAQEAE